MRKTLLYFFVGLLITVIIGCTQFLNSAVNKSAQNKTVLSKKTLYIVRHAKSDQSDTIHKIDFDRPLNEKGEKNAKTLGELLARKNIKLDAVISSPAKRTLETAKIICSELSIPTESILLDSNIYRCSIEEYVKIIQSIDDKNNHVMVIGHNPSTTSLANLLQKKISITEVPTAGIVAIEFNISSWSEIASNNGTTGKLLFFHDPDDINNNSD